MPKLPMPPLPDVLNPRPKRPGDPTNGAKPLDTAKEAGISAADWVDERLALSSRRGG